MADPSIQNILNEIVVGTPPPADNTADTANGNVANCAVGVGSTPSADSAFMSMFEGIAANLDQLSAELERLRRGSTQDDRLFKVIDFVYRQYELNEKMYDLLVELSNRLP